MKTRGRLFAWTLAAILPTGIHGFAQSIYDAYFFSTFAGVAGSPGNDDGTGSAAQFVEPQNLAVDSEGNVYVADHRNLSIRKVTPSGTVTTLPGAFGWPSVFGSGDMGPSGVAVDRTGAIYVADSGTHTISKMTPAGEITTLAGLAGTPSTGRYIGSADGTGSAARFYYPSGLAIDSAGNLYVADQGNHTIRKVTQEGVVTTPVGLAGVSGDSDGTGSSARFNLPYGLAMDAADNLYVADAGNHTIRRVTPAGVVTTLAGLAGSPGSADGTRENARFNGPNGVATDAAGNIYVADTLNHLIRKVTGEGAVTTLAGAAGVPGSADGTGRDSRFAQPFGLTVTKDGTVFVADTYNSTIRKGVPTTGPPVILTQPEGQSVLRHRGVTFSVAATGALPLWFQWRKDGAQIAGATTSSFSILSVQPTDVGAYSVVVSNEYGQTISSNAVLTLATPYTFATLAGAAGLPGNADGAGSDARFYLPTGVAVDGFGNIYVADMLNHSIRKVTAAGAVTTLAGPAGVFSPGTEDWAGSADGTGSEARFRYPIGVAVDSSGNVYVADNRNYTIRKITPAGVVTTLAGVVGSPWSEDGTGTGARFNFPNGVAVDSDDQLYVADSMNHTIRKVTPTGTVTTPAGLARTPGCADGPGPEARFNLPGGVATDCQGNVYVADSGNCTIRKMSTAGVVTTLAGLAGHPGSADGPGTTARFAGPTGVAVDRAGNIYVADTGNAVIRRVTPGGLVTTVAGIAGVSGTSDGTGNGALFRNPRGIAVDVAGNLYVADSENYTIRTGYRASPTPEILDMNACSSSNGSPFGFNLTGPHGQSAIVEASTNLSTWLPLWTNTLSGSLGFTDPQSGTYSHRFYRIRLP